MSDIAVIPQASNNGTNFEQQHVQHVYDEIAASMNDTQHKAWPNVKRFLKKFPSGSLIADIGCGNGRYLNINKYVYKVGVDVCTALVNNAQTKGYEVAYADNLHLPFRDDTFDGVVSVGVIHHFCSVERRIKALQELARVLRPGGRVMMYVWALEQKHRKFDCQDVLIPWRGSGRTRPVRTGSSSSFGPSSTSSVSEDESVSQSTDVSERQTSQNSKLQRQSSLSADDVSSLLELSDFKPNYYSLDFSTYPQERRRESEDDDHEYAWNKSSSRSCNARTDKLIRECRKLEASLRAMSAGNLELLEAKCSEENFARKLTDVCNEKGIGTENVNCNANEEVGDTGTGVLNGVVDEKELGVTLDWAVGDLESDDFEAEIPNPSAIYDSGFIDNCLNNDLEGCGEQHLGTESDIVPICSEEDKSNKHRKVDGRRHLKINPFMKQNSLDPYTFNDVRMSNSCNSDETSSIEVINESQEELEEVFVEFKPPLQGKVAKKPEKSFFSTVKSKLFEIFEDKKENKIGQKKIEPVKSKLTKPVQSPVSPLSEEQLDLASRLNFKVREFPLSSCPDVLNGDQSSSPSGTQPNNDKVLDNGYQSKVAGAWHQPDDNSVNKPGLLEGRVASPYEQKLSNEKSHHRCHSENELLNGIYDGYIKIDVNRLCKNSECDVECVQSSALIEGIIYSRDSKCSHSVDVTLIDHNFDRNTQTIGNASIMTNTGSGSTDFSGTGSSQNGVSQQSGNRVHKMSRLNSFPLDKFCRAGNNSRNECQEQSERVGVKEDDSVFEIEEEEMSSKLYRYYHVFRKGEMEKLISNHVKDLHIIQCFYDHANWCIVAEKL